MEEWKECTLSDLGTIVGGATPSTKDSSNYENGSIAWITPKDLSTHTERFISHGERNITEKGLKSCSAQLMPPNSILFTSRAPIGYIAIAKNEVCTNQGFKSIVPNKDTDFMFLYYLLRYNKDNIENLGSGTTFKEVSGSTMRNVPVKVPPLPTQQKIAAILSSLDDKIELNNKINTNLEQQAQAIFEDFFPNVIDDDGLNKMEESITFSNGKKRPEESGIIPVFGGNGILAYTNKSNNENCCIIGRVGAYCGNVFLSQNKCWISDNAISAKSKDTDSQFFIFYLLKKANLQTRHIGSGQPLLTQGILNSISINIPQKQTIEQFNDLLKPIFDQIFNNSRQNENLVSIRDTLLPKLMNGEIEV